MALPELLLLLALARRLRRLAGRLGIDWSAGRIVTALERHTLAVKLATRFERAEPRKRVLAYLTGLLSNTERKSGW